MSQKHQKIDLNQPLECTAPKYWSKYTTTILSERDFEQQWTPFIIQFPQKQKLKVTAVVYFNQQTSAPHAVQWSKSIFYRKNNFLRDILHCFILKSTFYD